MHYVSSAQLCNETNVNVNLYSASSQKAPLMQRATLFSIGCINNTSMTGEGGNDYTKTGRGV